jgi:DNA polymerase-3 subunit gamma/tau
MAGDTESPVTPAAENPSQNAPLALYRRYRPATFAELRGQEHVTEPLRQALRSGRVNHAYLFSGPRGCGKTSSARILARSLNCEQGPTPDPCGQCDSCVALAPSGPGSIDVIEIDAASHGGIDDARDLRERAFYSPVSARYKIYIIDEAHMVTGAGFNALLKLVEEPPPHLKFVFATTEPEKVIPTIRSRTHHYPFRLIPPAVLRDLLEEILKAEKISFEPAVLPVVVRAGAGSARDSLSILDQLIAGADEGGLRYDRAIALLGYTDEALLDEMVEAFASGEGAQVFGAIDRVMDAGHDPRRFAMDLLDRLRDLIVLAAVPDASSSGLLDLPADRLDRMRQQADRFGQERMVRAAETISAGLVEMRGATSPRLLLELMCAQVLLPATPAPAVATAGRTGGDLDARVERLERELAAALDRLAAGPARPAAGSPAAGSPAASSPAASSPAASSPGDARPAARAEPTERRPAANAPSPVAGSTASPGSTSSPGSTASAGSTASPASSGAPGLTASPGSAGSPGSVGAPAGIRPDAAVIRTHWNDILDAVREVRRVAWILLSNASVDSVEGAVLTLAFPREGDAKGFASSGCDQDLADVLDRMLGVRPVIRTITQSAAPRRAAPAQPPAAGSASVAPASAGSSSPGPSSPGPSSTGPSSTGPAQAGSPTRGSAAGEGTARQDGQPSEPRSNGRDQRSADAVPLPPEPAPEAAGRDHDDPRYDTDPQAPEGRGVTGTDLILRELGGRVIEEIDEE